MFTEEWQKRKVQETKEVILLLLLLLHPDDVRTREPGLWLTDSGQVRLVSLGKLELSHVLISCAISKLEHCCCQIGIYGLLLWSKGPDASQDGGLGALKHGGPHTCRVRWRCPAVPPALCGGETALSTAFLCLGCPLAAGQSHVAALVGEWLSNWARVRGVLEKVAADRAGGLSVS